MPDVISHWSMGDLVVERLPNNISSKMERNAFLLGLLGPDPFTYYYFFLPFIGKHIKTRAKVMHLHKTGDFLLELTKQAKNTNEFSYLTGFLCHYCLDSLSHPYIIRTADNMQYMHMAVEHAIDKIVLLNNGIECSEIINMFPQYQSFSNANKAIITVYGWSNHESKKCYKHMKLWYIFIIDRRRIVGKIISHINPSLACILYSSDYYKNIDYCKYRKLEEKAVDESVCLIKSAYDYKSNRITESEYRAVIGNHSYYNN